MHLLALPFTFLEIAVFIIAVIAFILAVRFFIASQKNLENLLPNSKKRRKSSIGISIDRDGFIVPTEKQIKKAYAEKEQHHDDDTRQEIKELRDMLQLQQLELTRALRQIENINTQKEEPKYKEEKYYDDEDEYEDYKETYKEDYKDDFQYRSEKSALTEELRQQLERKEAELRELRQQAELNNKLQSHFEEVQAGYEELQMKVQRMEQQAWQAAEMGIKVDSLQQAVDQLEKTVLKKEEKIREISVENGRLHEQLNITEDKLAEANLQRQQLLKKVQFLEEVNNDIQQMSDTNRKLKNELRRVGELESMLNLITEERDALLKRRITKF
jgi:chromosome segregation ATPase